MMDGDSTNVLLGPSFISWSCKTSTMMRLLFLVAAAPILTRAMAPAEPDIGGDLNECFLECYNQGTCVYWDKDLSKHPLIDPGYNNIDGMSCVCADTDSQQYTGVQCEVLVEPCGNDNDKYCYHGAKCNRDDECDCVKLNQENNKDAPPTITSYLGTSCEHAATASCSNNDPEAVCANGGTCKDIDLEGGEE